MDLACLDLEGVLVPEIWIRVAETTGIDELRLTTRDIAGSVVPSGDDLPAGWRRLEPGVPTSGVRVSRL